MRKIFFVIMILTLSGCSVIMAATPSEDKDLSVLKVGATRQQVEKTLGKPIKFNRASNGDFAVYQYFTGDEASYGRAATYAVLTGVTLGVSELFTSPVEALQGDRNEVHVLYSRSGRLRSFKKYIFKAPLPPPEQLVNSNPTQ